MVGDTLRPNLAVTCQYGFLRVAADTPLNSVWLPGDAASCLVDDPVPPTRQPRDEPDPFAASCGPQGHHDRHTGAPPSSSTGSLPTPTTNRLPLTVWLLGAVAFIMGTPEMVVAGLLPEVATSLDVSLGQAGLIIAVLALVAVILLAATSRRTHATASAVESAERN